jgi:hypothetical protein
MRTALPALAAALLAACGGSSGKAAATSPAAVSYDPDVPAWRGGCFLDGPAGKIVNGTPGPEVIQYGAACSGGSGGLVYLDGYDPLAGTGTVTVLPSTPGAKPIPVAPAGGGGNVVPASTGARIDDAGRRLLTLRNVGFVTGELVLVDLTSPGKAPRSLAANVRVLNYDFLPSGAVIFTGNYDPGTRRGDLFVWSGATPQPVALAVSRAEFQLYRLDPSRSKAAYLTAWSETGGGNLKLVDVSPSPGPELQADTGVERMEWTASGALVWAVRLPDGSASLKILPPSSAPGSERTLDTGVQSWTVAGDDVAYVKDWTLLAGYGTFFRASASGAPELGVPQVALDFGAASAPAPGTRAALAFVQVSDADRRAGTLWVVGAAGANAVEPGAVPRAGSSFSPGGGFLAWARGFADPSAPGSVSPQPGIADEVRVARIGGGVPFTVATSASMQSIAWDPGERFVGALSAFDAAANAGRLEVRDLASPEAALLSLERVPPFGFGFGDDGTVAAIGGWNDALLQGELVVERPGASPASVAAGVTSFVAPRGGRVIYAVRGGGRDGLWVY